MKKNDLTQVLKNIDINYNTNLNNRDILDDWYKDFKDYDIDDVLNELEKYKKNNYNYAPKKWQILNNLKTIEQKQIERNIRLQCPFCKRYIDGEKFDNHYDRCLKLEFLDILCLKVKGEHFNKESKSHLTDYELKNVYENTIIRYKDYITNEKVIRCLEKYFGRDKKNW